MYSISPFKILSKNFTSPNQVDGGNLSSIERSSSSICSKSIDSDDFASRSTHHGCFIIGEKSGLTLELMQCCDELLHVEFPGMTEENERAIGYESKIALCLQEFCIAKNFPLRRKDENMEKHIVAEADKEYVKTVRYSQMALKSAASVEFDLIDEDLQNEDSISLSNIFLTT